MHQNKEIRIGIRSNAC